MGKISFSALGVLLVALTLLVDYNATAQLFADDKVDWDFSIEQENEEVTVVVNVEIQKGWNIFVANPPSDAFFLPTTVEFPNSSYYTVEGNVIEPEPITEYDETADENLAYHSGTAFFKRKLKVLSQEDFVLVGQFEFQVCNDKICLAPHAAEIKLDVKGLKNN